MSTTLVDCDRETLLADLARRGLQAPTDAAVRAGISRALRDAWSLQDPSLRDAWFVQPYVLVLTGQRSGRVALYRWGAWDEPSETPMLPWSAPEGVIVGWVFRDGDIQIKEEWR